MVAGGPRANNVPPRRQPGTSPHYGFGIKVLNANYIDELTRVVNRCTNTIQNIEGFFEEIKNPIIAEAIQLYNYIMNERRLNNTTTINLELYISKFREKFDNFARTCRRIITKELDNIKDSIELIKFRDEIRNTFDYITETYNYGNRLVKLSIKRSYAFFLLYLELRDKIAKKKSEIKATSQKNTYNALILQNSISNNDISKVTDKALQIKLRVEQKKKKKQIFINENKIQNEQIKYFKNTSNFRKNNRYGNHTFSPNFKNELEKKRKEVIKDFTSAYKSARTRFLRGYVSYIKQLIRTGEANKNYEKEYRNATKQISSNYGSTFLRKYTREAAKSMSKTEQSYRKQIRKLVQVLKKKYKR